MANCVAAFPPAVGDEIELLNFDSSGAGGEFPPGEPGSLPDFPESTGIELAQAARPLTEFDDFWDFTKQVGQKEIKENKNENQVYHAMFRWTQNEKNDDYFGDHELLEKQLIKLSKDSEYVFQLECGEKTGRLHYEGWIHLKDKARPTTLAKSLNKVFNGIEIQKIYSDPKNCIEYCTKPKTRVAGPWPVGRMYEYDGLDVRVIERRPFLWQKTLLEMISDSPDPDKIVMIVDPSGGRGKSTFVKYCVYKKLGSFLSFSTYDNLKYNAAKALNQRAFLVDFPRQKPFELHWSSIFTALEQIKSGLWTSDKYQNIVVMIPRPHLVCFSNYMPELALLSLYKWSIASISDETTDFEFYTEEALVEIMEEQKAAKEEYKKKKRGQDN